MRSSIRKKQKVEEPVGKNKKAGHPKKNSGYAEDQPIISNNKRKVINKKKRR